MQPEGEWKTGIVVAEAGSSEQNAAWPGGPVVMGKEELHVDCPECGKRLTLGRIHFAGMPIFVECRCAGCSREYWLDWPAGHALLHPALIDTRGGNVYYDGLSWYPRLLGRFLPSRTDPASAAIHVRWKESNSSRAILINCVDFLYGHCLLKLVSGLSYARRYPDADVIVIAQPLLRWLIPAEASTIEVDLALSRTTLWIDGLQEVVKDLLGQYREFSISPGLSQPPVTADDITQLLGPGIAPQPFWSSMPGEDEPLVSLIVREDRLWLGSRRPLVPRVADHVSWRLGRWLRLRRQRKCFSRVVRRVRAARPDAEFAVIGLGTAGKPPAGALDLRQRPGTMTEERERHWLATYAKSRVVVGVHGSNMLLPSALAGAVINLLPPGRLRNIAQDLLIAGASDHEPKLALFRYRILPLSTSPDAVAETIVSMLNDADFHHKNMVENRAAYTNVGWPRPINWKPSAQGSASPPRA